MTGTPTATGSVGPIAVRRCSNTLPTPLAIPDLKSVSNAFIVGENATIADLDVEVEIDHPYVGDLFFTLTHVGTGTSVVLVDRPGDQTCNRDDIRATFDDEAARFVGFVCSIHEPSLGGGLVPEGFLDELDGESLAGTWRLDVADEAGGDVGSLVSWCLNANTNAPVVTEVSCNGEFGCALELGEPFSIAFSFTDRDANAASYRITALDMFENFFEIDQAAIAAPRDDGTVTVDFEEGFICEEKPCFTNDFEFFIEVTDQDGQVSPFASILITSFGMK